MKKNSVYKENQLILEFEIKVGNQAIDELFI